MEIKIKEDFRMVTTDGLPIRRADEKYKFSFDGLSTDTKPTKEYSGYPIANGSSFFELDTQSISFYDESTESWLS